LPDRALLAEALRARAVPAQPRGRNRRGATPPADDLSVLVILAIERFLGFEKQFQL
jgi:hypothetical protein